VKTSIAMVILLLVAAGLLFGSAVGQPPPIPTQEQPEVLTRGPVHEAFSEPVILQIQAGLVVPNQPPDDIDEIPPAERPRGDDFVWVPGYWSWDGDRDSFIWVSGCWRAAPPTMSWVPGYWSQEADGWEWVAGFWTPADIQDIEYLPAPPESDYMQPSSPSPSSDDIWVPSCQYWNQDHYIQRPGYWLAANPNWVWTPSHYVWTPRGYIFCDGHWDYPLENRGVLFAPVYFPQSIYSRSAYRYSPSIIVDLGILTINLFTYPRYSHYYFGDYYDNAYLSIGIYPRVEVDRIHTWYDPTYAYDRWHHRSDPRWEENQRHEYDRRYADKELRPPKTYHEMESRPSDNMPGQQRNNFRIVAPLTVVAARKETSLKFDHIDAGAQQKIAAQATAVRSFTAQRNRWESTSVPQQSVQRPVEHNARVTVPTEHKDPVTAAERKGPTTPSTERKVQATQPGQTKAPFVRPAAVHVTQPERVKVPAAPIVGKHTATQKSPPPRPVNERKYKSEAKVTPEDNQNSANTKAKAKNKTKDKGKDKGR